MRASPLGKNAMSHGLVIPEAQLSTDNYGVVLGGELLAGSEASGAMTARAAATATSRFRTRTRTRVIPLGSNFWTRLAHPSHEACDPLGHEACDVVATRDCGLGAQPPSREVRGLLADRRASWAAAQ